MDFCACGQQELISDKYGFGDDCGKRIAVMGHTGAKSTRHGEADLCARLDCIGLLSVYCRSQTQQNCQ